MPDPRPLAFDREGNIPVCDVKVKFPHLGSYDVTRWNASGRGPQTVGRGNTLDSLGDAFRLVRTRVEFSKLDGHYLTWVIWIQRTVPGSQAPWEFQLDLWQGETLVAREARQGEMASDFVPFRGVYRIELI